MLSPARPSSSSLRNISTPVATVLMLCGLRPTISTSSPTLTIPRSTRPVTTVPRPWMLNTSSIGIRNGLSTSRIGLGDVGIESVGQLGDRLARFALALATAAFESLECRADDDRDVVAREFILGEQLADFHLH